MAFDVLNPLDPLQAASVSGMFIAPFSYGYAGICFGSVGEGRLCLIGWAFFASSAGSGPGIEMEDIAAYVM